MAGVDLSAAQLVADTVLYEGYLLYPYRASAGKNHARWQFGVLVPPETTEQTGDQWFAQTECIVEAADDAEVHVRVRFLQLRTRTLASGPEWDEGDVRSVDVVTSLGRERVVRQTFAGGTETIDGVEFRREPVVVTVRVNAERLPGPYGVARLRVIVENTSDYADANAARDVVVRRALVGTHALLGVDHGTFVSAIDPPEWARPAVAACKNVHTYPVLVGDLVLSAPIILYDQPEIAPESPGALFDATEIDEILSLRTLALTDEEKAEARATDPRAAAIVDRVDNLPPEIWERLHGTIRSLRPVKQPEPEALQIHGVDVGPGTVVVLRPGARRADAQDMFLVGKAARVEAVLTDVEDERYVAVTLLDDPGADVRSEWGRFLYFSPEEVEPVS